MARYHISPRTGNPVTCKAKIRCPFGDMVADHYSSQEEARRAYEEKMVKARTPSFKPGKLEVSALPATMRLDERTLLVPKGMYVLGDPSQTAGSVDPVTWQKWETLAHQEESGRRPHAVGALLNGYPVVALRTKFEGKGVYFDNSGRDYPVESESVGLIPLTLLKRMGLDDNTINSTGAIVTFNEPTRLHYDDGILSFGHHLHVYTDEPLMEDEDVKALLEDEITALEA